MNDKTQLSIPKTRRRVNLTRIITAVEKRWLSDAALPLWLLIPECCLEKIRMIKLSDDEINDLYTNVFDTHRKLWIADYNAIIGRIKIPSIPEACVVLATMYRLRLNAITRDVIPPSLLDCMRQSNATIGLVYEKTTRNRASLKNKVIAIDSNFTEDGIMTMLMAGTMCVIHEDEIDTKFESWSDNRRSKIPYCSLDDITKLLQARGFRELTLIKSAIDENLWSAMHRMYLPAFNIIETTGGIVRPIEATNAYEVMMYIDCMESNELMTKAIKLTLHAKTMQIGKSYLITDLAELQGLLLHADADVYREIPVLGIQFPIRICAICPIFSMVDSLDERMAVEAMLNKNNIQRVGDSEVIIWNIIGAKGSGKSTWIRTLGLKENPEYFIQDSDDFGVWLTYLIETAGQRMMMPDDLDTMLKGKSRQYIIDSVEQFYNSKYDGPSYFEKLTYLSLDSEASRLVGKSPLLVSSVRNQIIANVKHYLNCNVFKIYGNYHYGYPAFDHGVGRLIVKQNAKYLLRFAHTKVELGMVSGCTFENSVLTHIDNEGAIIARGRGSKNEVIAELILYSLYDDVMERDLPMFNFRQMSAILVKVSKHSLKLKLGEGHVTPDAPTSGDWIQA